MNESVCENTLTKTITRLTVLSLCCLNVFVLYVVSMYQSLTTEENFSVRTRKQQRATI